MMNFNTPFVAGAYWVAGPKTTATLSDVADHIMHMCTGTRLPTCAHLNTPAVGLSATALCSNGCGTAGC
jgi:hypothetical protein